MTNLFASAEGRALARQFNCKFIETSAKSRINVDNSFYDIVREIRKYNRDMSAYGSNGTGANGKMAQMGMEGHEKEAGCCRCTIM